MPIIVHKFLILEFTLTPSSMAFAITSSNDLGMETNDEMLLSR